MLSVKAISSYQQLLDRKGVKPSDDIAVEAEQALKNIALALRLIRTELAKKNENYQVTKKNS